MSSRRAWTLAVVIGIVIGAVPGAFTMWAAWEHNPQGAFHEDGVIHWAGWLLVGASWFVPVAAFATLVSYLVLTDRSPSRSSDSNAPAD